MALEQEITMTFKEEINGFTTFKSYVPDWGLSLNNRYYTFRLGYPWEHNIETSEVIADIPITVPITITYERQDTFTSNRVFEITGDIGSLGLRTDDQLQVTIYDETNARLISDISATIPDPEQDTDGDDNPEIQLYSTDSKTELLDYNSSNVYYITILKRVVKNVVPRNIFYDNLPSQGLPYKTVVEFIINNDPTVVKQFKTLGYQGIGLWDFQVYTDVESEIVNEDAIPKVYDSTTLAGIINKDDLVEREGKFFANIQGNERDVTNLDLSSISVQGIGKGSPTGLAADSMVKMDATVSNDVRVGYGLYYFNNLAFPGEPDNYDDKLYYAGKIVSVDGDIIEYDKGQSGEDPSVGDFMLYARNNVIEKSGVTGSFAHVIMSNDDEGHAEVFTVNSEVVQSSR